MHQNGSAGKSRTIAGLVPQPCALCPLHTSTRTAQTFSCSPPPPSIPLSLDQFLCSFSLDHHVRRPYPAQGLLCLCPQRKASSPASPPPPVVISPPRHLPNTPALSLIVSCADQLRLLHYSSPRSPSSVLPVALASPSLSCSSSTPVSPSLLCTISVADPVCSSVSLRAPISLRGFFSSCSGIAELANG